jgi:hypothetical protein
MTAAERLYVVTVATDYVVHATDPADAADRYREGDAIGTEVVAVDGYGWSDDDAAVTP